MKKINIAFVVLVCLTFSKNWAMENNEHVFTPESISNENMSEDTIKKLIKDHFEYISHSLNAGNRAVALRLYNDSWLVQQVRNYPGFAERYRALGRQIHPPVSRVNPNASVVRMLRFDSITPQ
jgi:hypothetical protein